MMKTGSINERFTKTHGSYDSLACSQGDLDQPRGRVCRIELIARIFSQTDLGSVENHLAILNCSEHLLIEAVVKPDLINTVKKLADKYSKVHNIYELLALLDNRVNPDSVNVEFLNFIRVEQNRDIEHNVMGLDNGCKVINTLLSGLKNPEISGTLIYSINKQHVEAMFQLHFNKAPEYLKDILNYLFDKSLFTYTDEDKYGEIIELIIYGRKITN